MTKDFLLGGALKIHKYMKKEIVKINIEELKILQKILKHIRKCFENKALPPIKTKYDHPTHIK